MQIDWQAEVLRRREEIIQSTREFLRIKSVKDENSAQEGAPFGTGIWQAMAYLLQKCEDLEMATKNLDGYATHAEMGEGEELVGVLCHVDVVPAGEGWVSPPFAADLREGKIYARGAIDDKGPTVAILYALKIIKELNLPLRRRVRLIIGGDEESGWRCMDRYFAEEAMPDFGFAPDAVFPMIYAEKGICDVVMVLDADGVEAPLETAAVPAKGLGLRSLKAGERLNMVPDKAEAEVVGEAERLSALQEQYLVYLKEHGLRGEATLEGGAVHLTCIGRAAHGMEPFKGVNAGLMLAHFLAGLQEPFDTRGAALLQTLEEGFYDDFYGEELRIAYEDEITGPLTVNLGTMDFRGLDEPASKESLGMTIRYPVTTDFEQLQENLGSFAQKRKLGIASLTNKVPHYVDTEHFLVKTLRRVYEAQTGLDSTPLSIGGGTYARTLEAGVAFGPLFPGREETAHQKDEYIEVEDLLKMTAIYAQAIYELAQ